MSKRWYQENRRDPWRRQAKSKGYRARSAYKLKQIQDDEFRYISFDNSLPTIVTIVVRHAGKVEDLGDNLLKLVVNL